MSTKVKCIVDGCNNMFVRRRPWNPRMFCSDRCRDKYRHATKPMKRHPNSCYCYEPLLANGKCKWGCPPEANPAWLAEQAAKRRARDEHARREERVMITDDDLQRMRAAMRRLDPVTRHVSPRRILAAKLSHAPGARR